MRLSLPLLPAVLCVARHCKAICPWMLPRSGRVGVYALRPAVGYNRLYNRLHRAYAVWACFRMQPVARRHICTSGLASSAPWTFLFALFWSTLSYFVPNGLPVARDGWATGWVGQVRSRDTTSGSPDVTSSRIPRLRSRRVWRST